MFDLTSELTGFDGFCRGCVEAERFLSRQQGMRWVEIMELGYRIDGRAGLGERDIRDIFLFPTTSPGEDDRHE